MGDEKYIQVLCEGGRGGERERERERENAYRVLLGKPQTNYLKDLGVDGKISLN